jgi:hypothetical protein
MQLFVIQVLKQMGEIMQMIRLRKAAFSVIGMGTDAEQAFPQDVAVNLKA